jgi:microcystin-dependent protein
MAPDYDDSGPPAATMHSVTIDDLEIATTGNSAPQYNMRPLLVLNTCIALVGIFARQG